jgi:hypothetical protein
VIHTVYGMVYGWLFVNGLIMLALGGMLLVGSVIGAVKGMVDRRQPAPMDIETARELDALEAIWRLPDARRDVRPPS